MRDLSKKAEKQTEIALFIGPEGGFDATETGAACADGIRTMRVGPRIMRTETAGVVILSILMYIFGDM